VIIMVISCHCRFVMTSHGWFMFAVPFKSSVFSFRIE
jgi:hypothetical protein